MNIFIAGAGRVGTHLARLLCADKQDVSVIEADPEERERIDYALDVSTAVGDATSVMFLQSLNVDKADLFVASMGNDEKNLIAAATAKGLGAKRVIARVDNATYIESNVLYESILGVDYIMTPDSLAALQIAQYIQQPGVLAMENFGRGRVQLRQIQVSETPTVDGKTLKDVIDPGSGVLLGVINRRGKSFIPHGDTVVKVGDHITLVGLKENLAPVQQLFHYNDQKARRVAIVGGSTVGVRLAQALEGKVRTVKLFERREERCNTLAARLEKAKIVCRDATSRTALEQEHINDFDVLVAATGDDERNIMAGVLAKEVGVNMVVAIVKQPDFAPLVERLGVDLAITPRACMANRILRLVHQDKATSLAILGEGQVEVIEFEIGDGSPILGKQIRDYRSKFPRGALIATILRGDSVIVPSGDDEIHAGDSVILIASSESVDAARKLFQRK